MKLFKLYSTIILAFLALASFNINADISEAKLNEIETRVNSMSYNELVTTRSSLLQEKEELEQSEPNSFN